MATLDLPPSFHPSTCVRQGLIKTASRHEVYYELHASVGSTPTLDHDKVLLMCGESRLLTRGGLGRVHEDPKPYFRRIRWPSLALTISRRDVLHCVQRTAHTFPPHRPPGILCVGSRQQRRRLIGSPTRALHYQANEPGCRRGARRGPVDGGPKHSHRRSVLGTFWGWGNYADTLRL